MLYPAQLFSVELQNKITQTWYKDEYKWYHAGPRSYQIDLPDNTQYHHFVSVNRDDEVIGYICYNPDWEVMSASQWGIICFSNEFGDKYIFAKDVMKAIDDCFTKYHFQRVEYACYNHNPILNAYYKFLEKANGHQAGYHCRVAKLRDGSLYDSIDFEILWEDYRRSYMWEKFNGKKV